MASFIYAFPQYMQRWWAVISTGEIRSAVAMQQEVNDLLQTLIYPLILSEGYSEIAATKAVVDAVGVLKAGPPRKPFRAVPPQRIENLRNDLESKFPQFLS